MDAAVQPRVLKVLEDGRFRRLGSVQDRRANVRVIAATQQDLPRLVGEGRFRGDLYYRICAFPINVPPLRERTEDVPQLARVILARICAEMGRAAVELTDAAERKLQSYAWPGNIRELRNVLERALLLRAGHRLEADDLGFESAPVERPQEGGPVQTLQEAERQLIESVLRLEGGKVAAAAKRLGVQRSTLYHKIRRHGIDPEALSKA